MVDAFLNITMLNIMIPYATKNLINVKRLYFSNVKALQREILGFLLSSLLCLSGR